MARVLRATVQVCCWCALLAAGLGVLLHFYPARHLVAIALTAAAPLLMVMVVPAVVGFAVLRKMIGLLTAVVVAAVCTWVQLPLFIADGADATGTSVVVLQTNIELGQGDPGRIAELAERHDVDVLAVNELTAEAAEAIDATSVGYRFPYTYLQPERRAGGTGVWSRFPISSPRRLDGFLLASLQMSLSVPQDGGPKIVQLFAFHPVYPLEPVGWSDELNRIRAVLEEVPTDVPVIAPGDYNATYDHTAYRRLLTNGYVDAGEIAGAGFLPTYPTDRFTGPLFAIDHVVLRNVGARRVVTEVVPGADHRAVVAELVLPGR